MKEEKPDKGNLELAAGAGIGAYGTAMAITAGFVCPACVIAAPALLGAGLYKRHKAKKAEASLQNDHASDT